MRIDELSVGERYRLNWPGTSSSYNILLNSKENATYCFSLCFKEEVVLDNWTPAINDIVSENWSTWSDSPATICSFKSYTDEDTDDDYIDYHKDYILPLNYDVSKTAEIIRLARIQGAAPRIPGWSGSKKRYSTAEIMAAARAEIDKRIVATKKAENYFVTTSSSAHDMWNHTLKGVFYSLEDINSHYNINLVKGKLAPDIIGLKNTYFYHHYLVWELSP